MGVLRKRTDDNENRIKKQEDAKKEKRKTIISTKCKQIKKRGTKNKKTRKNGLKVRPLFLRLKNSGVTPRPFATFCRKSQTAWE